MDDIYTLYTSPYSLEQDETLKMVSEIMRGRHATKGSAEYSAPKLLSVMQAKILLAAACFIAVKAYKSREEVLTGVFSRETLV